MSASQQKRVRANKRDDGADKRLAAKKKAENEAKKEKRRVIIVCVVLAILIVVLVAFNSNLLYNNFTAVQIDDVSYTASEYSFFYYSSYYSYVNNYSSLIQYIGLDTSKSLRSQTYPFDTGMTWADYFRDSALSNMKSVTMLWTEAVAAGFILSEEQQAELDETISSFATAHEGTDYPSADSYISTNYGKGLTLDGLTRLLEMSQIAEAYAESKYESFTYADEEIEANYVEKKDDFDSFNFLSYFVSGAADEDNGIDTETAMANAKETANSILESISVDSDDKTVAFKQAVLDITQVDATETSGLGNSLSDSFPDGVISWVTNTIRTYGDKSVVETDDGYYAVFFISRDDNNYNLVSARHILFSVEADEEGVYTDEAKEAALKEAEDTLAEWKDGEMTEDSFAELAETYSDDSRSDTTSELNAPGGLYEDIYKGQMVPEFNDWIFDSSRKTGNTGIVFNEGSYCGYHIIYFVGHGDTYRSALSENDLRSADYTAWYEAQLESFTATKGFTAFLVK